MFTGVWQASCQNCTKLVWWDRLCAVWTERRCPTLHTQGVPGMGSSVPTSQVCVATSLMSQYLRRRYKGSYISLSLFFCEIWWLIEIRSNSQGHAFSSEIQFLIIWYWKNTWEIYCEFHCLSYTTCWEFGPVESRQIWLAQYDPFNLHSFSFFNSQVTIFSKSMIHQSRSLYNFALRYTCITYK